MNHLRSNLDRFEMVVGMDSKYFKLQYKITLRHLTHIQYLNTFGAICVLFMNYFF